MIKSVTILEIIKEPDLKINKTINLLMNIQKAAKSSFRALSTALFLIILCGANGAVVFCESEQTPIIDSIDKKISSDSLQAKQEKGPLASPHIGKGVGLTGGRSKASVIRLFLKHQASLQNEYKKRLRNKPDLNGEIVVKFEIDWTGTIIFCEVVKSSMNDPDIEKIVIKKIKRWKFDKIGKEDKSDVTQIILPIVFNK
jgi:TonB family protein